MTTSGILYAIKFLFALTAITALHIAILNFWWIQNFHFEKAFSFS